ncbi:hypothetical protein BDZ89DRAFT_412553 [Hymenopellis radicata]|nr:hypothetical protein BDZ89DRAFT_412553 [Hymenopellis radicata]
MPVSGAFLQLLRASARVAGERVPRFRARIARRPTVRITKVNTRMCPRTSRVGIFLRGLLHLGSFFCLVMDGVPWELDQLPRGQYIDPEGDLFGSPPVRKRRTRKTKDAPLGTISESTTDVDDDDGHSPSSTGGKVQRAQINTLAKMLSALRR